MNRKFFRHNASLFWSSAFLLILSCLVVINPVLAEGGTWGIYLDEAGEIVCAADTMVYYNGYLIVKTETPIWGYQLKIDADPNIVVTLKSMPPHSLNVGMWPILIVGFSEPLLPVHGQIQLAELTLLPVSSGGVYITNLPSGDYFSCLDNLGEQFTPSLEFGGGTKPVLSFGLIPCPERGINHSIDPPPIDNVLWGNLKAIYSKEGK